MNVWDIAKSANRDYITPEDVTEAFKSGETRENVWREVLQAIEAGCVEDASCTAFVALKGLKFRRRQGDGSIKEVY